MSNPDDVVSPAPADEPVPMPVEPVLPDIEPPFIPAPTDPKEIVLVD